MKTPTSTPANVMVVDDTSANLKLLDALLRKRGHHARLFPRGALALKAAAVSPPDLVLLDIMMPEMDGYEVCRRLKAMPDMADVPVIFISAQTEVDGKLRAFEEGGVDYVTKPFHEAEVLARVDTHLTLLAMRRALNSQKVELEELVQERTADLLRAQRVAHIGSWKLDLRTESLTWSPETYRMFGVPEGTPLSLTDFLDRVHPDDRERVTREWVAALQGAPYDIEHRLTPPASATWVRERAEFDTDPQGQTQTVWGTVQDISEAKAHAEHVAFITHHDLLTGLPNRAQFLDILRVSMAACVTLQSRLVVAYIDLDGFAFANEHLGRDLGDQVIVEIARRLALSVRDRQYLARIGGDEFAVILNGICGPDAFEVPVHRMLRSVAEPIEIGGQTIQLTASIGLTVFPQHSEQMEPEQLLRQADQAMYLAKLTGKNRYHLFDPTKDQTTRERFIRIEEVRLGLSAGEMRLYYQPKVLLGTGKVVGFEALIRWQHPTRGLVQPGQFIPLLEQHPLAVTLGDWVIETALAQLALWNREGFRTCVSVNIDAQQLSDPDFVSRLARQLAAEPDVAPGQLELEILETGALENIAEEAQLIARIRQMGVACALDDFGTGYSSLNFLKQLGVQTIKIDQSFVRGMLDDGEHARIIHSVLGLARSFERATIAEGVESLEHGRMLLELGCEMAQGYAIARPMPADEVPAWLARWQLPEEWRGIAELSAADVSLLLAEVEHQQWLSELRRHLVAPDYIQLSVDERACRLGRWLSRSSTVERLGHLPAFGELLRCHSQLHEMARELLPRLKSANAEPDAWQPLESLSDRLRDTLRALRS